MNKSKILNVKYLMEFIPTDPFNFDATMHKPDHFPAADNDWKLGSRWQTMRWQKIPLGLMFENKGTIDKPKIILSIWSTEQLDQNYLSLLADEIDYRYNLQLDLIRFYHKFESDAELGPILNRWRGMRPLNYSSLYEYLIIAIVLQNATVRRSVSMMQVLLENYGTLLSYNGKSLYCFWEPEVIARTSEQQLRDLKVGYRAKSIKRITEAFVKKEVDEFKLRNRSKEEQRQTLLDLYGIGPASVGYILFDLFHHLDELNYISPWEQKIYSKIFFNTKPDDPVSMDELLAFFNERFGEYRMLAVHYFWEDLFWKRKTGQVTWLEKLIRL